MKRFKAVAAIVMIASAGSFAGMDLMIGGGLNMSNLSYSGDYKEMIDAFNGTTSMLVGFNAGANLAIPFSDNMGLVTGLNYETRGAKTKTEFLGVTGTTTSSASYLQVPILFSYKPIAELAINLGPELGICLGAKSKDEDGTEETDSLSALDFGASVGVSYTIINMIVVGAGYYIGFLNTQKAEEGVSGSITNSNLKFTVAYVLHL